MSQKEAMLQPLVRQALIDNYAIELVNLVKVPAGEESISWKVETASDKTYFAKYCAVPNSIANLDKVSKFLHFASTKLGFVVPPILTLDGVESVVLNSGKLYLYPFIDGQMWQVLNHEMSQEQQAWFSGCLVALHNYYQKNSQHIHLPQETFTPWFRQRYEQFESFVWSQLSPDQEMQIWKMLVAFEKLALKYQSYKHFTVTHGDLHGRNILDAKDQVYLVDWDGVMLAPIERDLNAFNENTQMLRKVCTKIGHKLNPELVCYYNYYWVLSEIIWEMEVLEKPKDPEQKQSALQEIASYTDFGGDPELLIKRLSEI